MQETLSAVNIALAFIKRQRKDTAYQSFYSLVVLKAKKYTDDPVLLRYRRPPRRLDVRSAPHSFAPPEKYYRVKYYEALDFTENEISRRFAQGSLEAPDSTSARNNSRPLAILRPISALGRPKLILVGHISCTFSMEQ